jgi:hypothetical protein
MFPSNSKHEMHRDAGEMNTDCNMWHTNDDTRNPYIGSSQEDGNGNSPGLGCSGRHNGRGLRIGAARTNENWTLNDFEGLDNDCDNVYDTADPDCTVLPAGSGEAPLLTVALELNGDLSFSWGDSCATQSVPACM